MRRRKKEKGLSVEEVFKQTSKVVSASIAVPRSNVVLTPISSEACLRHGINPEVLRWRELDSFWEPNIDPVVQQMRHQAYSQRRMEMMKIASDERAKLLDLQKRKAEHASEVNVPLTPAQMLDHEARINNTLIEAERQRLEKVKNRQKKDLMQVLQFESKMDKIQKDVKAKAERDARNEERRKREKERKERLASEERRMKDMRRKAQEDEEDIRRRIIAQEEYEREQKIAKQKQQEEREMRRRAFLIDEERKRKQEAHRIQTEHNMERQRYEIQRKLDERAAKEKELQMKMEQKRHAEQLAFALRRQETNKRIAANLEAAKRIEDKRKAALLDKQARHKKMQEQIKVEQQLQREVRQKRNDMLERKRVAQLRATREKEEETKETLRKRFEEDESYIAQIMESKQRELAITKEKKELAKQIKRDNVERIKRKQEFERNETERKLAENDRRTKEMQRKKEDLVAQRRQAAQEAKRQKDKLMNILDKSKTTGGKSIEKILVLLEAGEDSYVSKKKKRDTCDRESKQRHGDVQEFDSRNKFGRCPAGLHSR